MGALAQDTRTQVSGWREELDYAAGSAGTLCREVHFQNWVS